MLAATSASSPTITSPLVVLLGIALYLLIKAEPRMPKLPLVVGVLFGATASATILAIVDGIIAGVHKG